MDWKNRQESNEDRLITVGQVAKMFQVTPYTVRVWIKEGKLKATKPGGEWRVKHSDALEFAKGKFKIS